MVQSFSVAAAISITHSLFALELFLESQSVVPFLEKDFAMPIDYCLLSSQ